MAKLSKTKVLKQMQFKVSKLPSACAVIFSVLTMQNN